MAMDFFQHQEDAQRKSKRLVVIFLLGVLAIIVSVHAAISVTLWQSVGRASARSQDPVSWVDAYLLNPELFGWVALGVVAVVASGSLYKLKALGGGGEKVASSLGGRRLDPGTDDLDERKVLNVVEEMAIASGIPVPPVFIMDGQDGINAFAAGYAPGDAVIGVTRGAVRHLTRDELQGVIAHEFSHILNGDMRLNLRLIGILHGVLLIGIIGRLLLHSGGRRRRGKGKGNQAALLGLALLVIGYIGTLCGNLIKAAVSRQREFLADASAVQFTRNPEGLGGALRKLGGLPRGSKIEHPQAEELSHMYFGQGITNKLGSIFATHPPLAERVKRVDPSFDGTFSRISPEESRAAVKADRSGDARVAGLAGAAGAAAAAAAAGAPGEGREAETAEAGAREPLGPGTVSLDEALAQVGQPTEAHLTYVRSLLESVPAPLRTAAHEREGAQAMLYALLMDRDPEVRARQDELLKAEVSESVLTRVSELSNHRSELDPNARLPLLETAISTLKGLEEEGYRRLRDTVEALTRADDQVEIFEWVAGSLVLRHLDPHFSEEARKGSYTHLRGLSDSVVRLLSALAHAGHEDPGEVRRAFREGMDVLPELSQDAPLASSACGPLVLDAALDRLAHLVPGQKKRVLEACARAIAADRKVTTREGELFRVVADWMECPVPPLLPGQKVM